MAITPAAGFVNPTGALIIGIADFTWTAGDLQFTGIALGSIAALIVYHGMRLLGLRTARASDESADPAPEPR